MSSTLGDMLRVLRHLGAKRDDAESAAEMLGYEARAVRPPLPSRSLIALQKASGTAIAESPPSPPHGPEPQQPLRISIAGTRSAPPRVPRWVHNTEGLSGEALRYHRAQPALDPLLAPRVARAILAALLAARVDDGPLDIERMVETIARHEPPTLHRAHTVSIRRGVQVLVDMSRSMELFRHDQEEFVRALHRVIGRGRAPVSFFAGSPMRDVRTGDDLDWFPYVPPAPSTPVLLLTDFGISAPPLERVLGREWRAFSETVRAAHCPLLALVPFPRNRWPAEVARIIAIAQWDRPLTARAAREVAAAAWAGRT